MTCQMGYPLVTEMDDDGFMFMQDIVTLDEHRFLMVSLFINSTPPENAVPEVYEVSENGDVFMMEEPLRQKDFITVF